METPCFSYHICEYTSNKALDDTLKAYFALEDTGIKRTAPVVSVEDERALRILEVTTISVKEQYE